MDEPIDREHEQAIALAQLQAERISDRKDLETALADIRALAEIASRPEPSQFGLWTTIVIALIGIGSSLWGFGIGPIEAKIQKIEDVYMKHEIFMWEETRQAREHLPVVITRLDEHETRPHINIARDILLNTEAIEVERKARESQ